MKRLILLELALLFLATTFSSNPPPGWYQQSLPVNDFVNDIFFLDSLTGWIVTQGDDDTNDTSYTMKTSNGGINWEILNTSFRNYKRVQFINSATGFSCGSSSGSSLWKTVDEGYNWSLLFNAGVGIFEDLHFLNNDTGWVASPSLSFGGIWKTTDGGNNWVRQLAGSLSVQIKSIFLLNADTGWAVSTNSSSDLYRTTNGGVNWNVQYTFVGSAQDIYFVNRFFGLVSKAVMSRTTDGGFTWEDSPQSEGGIDIKLVTDSIGWGGQDLNHIAKTTNGGKTWFYQSSPIFNNSSVSIIDTLKGWAAGTGVVKTTNGGITSVISNISEIPEVFILHQNYPNPFNSVTKISYQLKNKSYVKLIVYDAAGKLVKILVSQEQNAGEYDIDFNGSELNSGVYFYKIEITPEKTNQTFSDTKKMFLIK